METMNASDFKARAFALLETVARTGEGITILKRGKPIARLLPVRATGAEYPQRSLRGSVRFHGDVIAPAEKPGVWEALGGGP